MSARRLFWWFVSPFLAPFSFGAFAWYAGRRVLSLVQLAVTLISLALLASMVFGGVWADMAVDPTVLAATLGWAVMAAMVLLWSALTQWSDARLVLAGPAAATAGWSSAVLVTVALSALAAGVLWVGLPQIAIARDTFVSAPAADPTPLPSTLPPIPIPKPVSTTQAPTTTEAPTPEPTRFNLLLLGGDAGPGRYGLRTDSVNLVSVDTVSGDVAMIGIPRNIKGAPMPPGPLADEFPKGFTNLFNAIYGWGEKNAELVRQALGPTDAPGASLVAASAAELLGVRVDAWVLIDMAGFIDIVDAFGGVDVYVTKTLPAAGPVPANRRQLPHVFEPGWQRMDGTFALSYARSRKADSDYRRMARQRCLMASLAAQNGPSDFARVWPDLSRVVAERVRTNLNADQLRMLTDLVGTDVASGRSVGLTPPEVPTSGWSAELVRRIVATAIDPTGSAASESTSTTTTTTSTSAPTTTSTTSAPTPGSPTSSSTSSSTTAVPTVLEPAETVGDTCRTLRPSS